MKISRDLLEEMVAHSREEAPNECCGMVSVRDGEVVRIHRATNVEASPLRFNVDPQELFRIWSQIDDADEELGAIYHSHTRTAPEPSQTDINFAQGWPGVLWVIVGLAADRTEVRTWRIDGGQVSEVELDVR